MPNFVVTDPNNNNNEKTRFEREDAAERYADCYGGTVYSRENWVAFQGARMAAQARAQAGSRVVGPEYPEPASGLEYTGPVVPSIADLLSASTPKWEIKASEPVALSSLIPAPLGPVVVVATPKQEQERRAAIIEKELAIFTAAGFAPQAAYYANGSEINSTGVYNFEQSKDDHAAMLPLAQAAATIPPIVAAEQRRVQKVRLSDLRLDVSAGGLLLGGGGLEPVQLTRKVAQTFSESTWGHVLFSLAHMERCKPEQVADHFNARIVDSGSRVCAFGLREIAGKTQVFRMTTERYKPFSVARVAEAIQQAADRFGVEFRGTAHYDSDESSIRVEGWLHADRVEDIGAGSAFKVGFSVTAGDDGKTGINMFSQYLRNLCLNLIMLDHGKQNIVALTHKASQRDIASTLGRGFTTVGDTWLPFGEQWGAMAARTIAETLRVPVVGEQHTEGRGKNAVTYAVTQRDQARLALSKIAKRYPITGIKRDTLTEMLLNGWDIEPGATMDSVHNAFTRLHDRVPVRVLAEVAKGGGAIMALS